MNKIQIAHDIAHAAACMDDLQSESCTGLAYMQTRERAKAHVKRLHDIAEELAGPRVAEIYAPDGEPE